MTCSGDQPCQAMRRDCDSDKIKQARHLRSNIQAAALHQIGGAAQHCSGHQVWLGDLAADAHWSPCYQKLLDARLLPHREQTHAHLLPYREQVHAAGTPASAGTCSHRRHSYPTIPHASQSNPTQAAPSQQQAQHPLPLAQALCRHHLHEAGTAQSAGQAFDAKVGTYNVMVRSPLTAGWSLSLLTRAPACPPPKS